MGLSLGTLKVGVFINHKLKLSRLYFVSTDLIFLT